MTTYIPSRIDSVLRNLTDQAELWQKEAQYRQKMGVELYELGLKSNRSDLMEQGVNMIERRDTLARPFAKRFQFNYEGSGLDRGEIKDAGPAPTAQMDGRFKPKTAQEANAFIVDSISKDKTSASLLKTDPLKWMQQQSGMIDFNSLMQNKDEWNKLMSDISYMSTDKSLASGARSSDEIMNDVISDLDSKKTYQPENAITMESAYYNPRVSGEIKPQMPLGDQIEAGKYDRTAPTDKELSLADKKARESILADRSSAYKQSFSQIQKHRDTVKADALRFTNETKEYNTRKEKVEAANRRAMEMNAEIDEIDRMITSKDGQVRAEGYRRLHEYEVDKAKTEREIIAADNRYQSNMANLMLHYNDPIDPRVFGTKRDFGRSGPAAKFESYSAMVPVNGKMIRDAFNIPVGTPNVKDWIINHYKAKGIKVSYEDIEDIVKTGDTGYKGETESKVINDFDGNLTPEAISSIQAEVDKEVNGLAVFNTTTGDAAKYVTDNRARFAEKGLAIKNDEDKVVVYVPKARDSKGYYTIINGKYKKYDGSNVKFIASEEDKNNYFALFNLGASNVAKESTGNTTENTSQNSNNGGGTLSLKDLENFKPLKAENKKDNRIIKIK